MESKEKSVKRRRTRFNSIQIKKMEKVFRMAHYPDAKLMEKLCLEISIPINKMQIWFQNRRAKWRKGSRLTHFGGLARMQQTKYVPAPTGVDTIKSDFDSYFSYYEPQYYSQSQNVVNTSSPQMTSTKNLIENLNFKEYNENSAIDLSKASVSCIELSPELMPTVPKIYEKSSAYKKSGGITSIRSTDHMNAFEYTAPYYGRHNANDKKEIQSLVSFEFTSNQSMTFPLLGPTLIYNKPIHIGEEYVSDIQNTYVLTNNNNRRKIQFNKNFGSEYNSLNLKN